MAYEGLKLASSRNGDLAGLRASALKQAAGGMRFADSMHGDRSIRALRDMAEEAALAGDDDLCVAIKTSLQGGALSPAQFRTMMAAAKKAEGARAKADATSAKPRASTPPAKPAAAKSAPSLTGYDLQRSADRARQAERDRWAGVMLDPAAKGKERDAAHILAGTDQSPKAILAFLADPDGAKEAAAEERAKGAKAGEVWDAAIASVFPGRQAKAEPRQSNASAGDDVWDRAIAAIYPKTKETTNAR